MGDLGIEPSVRLREGVTVPCHTLRPVAHFVLSEDSTEGQITRGAGAVKRKSGCAVNALAWQAF